MFRFTAPSDAGPGGDFFYHFTPGEASARMPLVGSASLDLDGGIIARRLLAIAIERLAEQLDPGDIALALHSIIVVHYRAGGNPHAQVESIISRIAEGLSAFEEGSDPYGSDA